MAWQMAKIRGGEKIFWQPKWFSNFLGVFRKMAASLPTTNPVQLIFLGYWKLLRVVKWQEVAGGGRRHSYGGLRLAIGNYREFILTKKRDRQLATLAIAISCGFKLL